MNQLDQPNDDTIADAHIPSPEQFAIAMTRALANMLELSRLCLTPRCRRSGTCKGDPRDCLAVAETVLSVDVVDGARLLLEAKLEGLTFDQALFGGQDQIEAYAHWVGRIAPKTPAPRR